MKALLHPTYFPTIASFSLLVTTPCILEVSDNYQKQTYRNRTYIYGANGRQILTVPILHTGGETGRQLYKEVRVDNNVAWQKQHWKTLQTAYRTSPYEEFRYLTDAKRPYEGTQTPYYQIFSDKHGFIPNLSILDLLFHEGNHALDYLREGQ